MKATKVLLAFLFLVSGISAASQESKNDQLGKSLDISTDSINSGAANQERLNKIDDETRLLEFDYKDTIKEYENLKLYNDQLQRIINSQEEEIISILNQIDENWSRPPGIKTSKNLIIKVIVGLDINGNVINLQIHKNTLNEIARDIKLQPYLDSAIRAIKKASPFEGLKKDRYNNWKELIINFKPIEAR